MSYFPVYASISLKRFEIRPKLLLITNRKLRMGFRLALRSMTLDDLKLDRGRPPFFSNT